MKGKLNPGDRVIYTDPGASLLCPDEYPPAGTEGVVLCCNNLSVTVLWDEPSPVLSGRSDVHRGRLAPADILHSIGVPAMLENLAEECCELGKAALKLSRFLREENPTPADEMFIRQELCIEATDVALMLDELKRAGLDVYDSVVYGNKRARWAKRLKGADHVR